MTGGRNSGAVYNMYPCKVGAQVTTIPLYSTQQFRRPILERNLKYFVLQHKYKKHKKNPPNPKSPMMKQQMGFMPGMEKMDSPKSVYLSDDQASCSSQTNSMSAPPSPHPESLTVLPNILKAVLTGSQEVSKQQFIA